MFAFSKPETCGTVEDHLKASFGHLGSWGRNTSAVPVQQLFPTRPTDGAPGGIRATEGHFIFGETILDDANEVLVQTINPTVQALAGFVSGAFFIFMIKKSLVACDVGVFHGWSWC